MCSFAQFWCRGRLCVMFEQGVMQEVCSLVAKALRVRTCEVSACSERGGLAMKQRAGKAEEAENRKIFMSVICASVSSASVCVKAIRQGNVSG